MTGTETSVNDSKYEDSREILTEASILEFKADQTFDEERSKMLRERALELRGAAKVNRTLRDIPYVGRLLSGIHYFWSV